MGALDCVTSNKIAPTESTEVFTVKMASSYTLSDASRDVESQSRTAACSTNKRYCWTIGMDLPIFIIVFTLIVLFELGVIPCHKSGFYCNDPALSFPYLGDTVSTGILMSILILWPLVVMSITEYAFSDSDDSPRSRLFQSFRNTSWLYRAYLYGLMMNLCIIEVMKGIVGGPRPTFFDICNPDAAATCNGSTTKFISNFQCTETPRFSWWEQLDSYRSFPSGHTSMSVFCGMFVACYLQKRAFNWSHRTILLVPAVQLFSISFSVVSSLTRVTDRRHHWWDVLAGTAIAFLALFYTVSFLCDNFSHYMSEKSEEKSNASQTTNDTLLFDEQRIVT